MKSRPKFSAKVVKLTMKLQLPAAAYAITPCSQGGVGGRFLNTPHWGQYISLFMNLSNICMYMQTDRETACLLTCCLPEKLLVNTSKSVCLPVLLFLSVFLPACLAFCLFVCPSVCPYFYTQALFCVLGSGGEGCVCV